MDAAAFLRSEDIRPSARAGLAGLALGALGIVYGDIGTSPLYTIKECFHGVHAVAPSEANILGILSLIFWSLVFVVSIKYLTFVMLADNRGEGGIFALLALLPPTTVTKSSKTRSFVIQAALLGAALLYGDGFITPSISVLSAVEGLDVATHSASSAVVPITCIILALLFFFQSRGTAKIGRVFGPIMLLWFLTIGAFGIQQILLSPHILLALNPLNAARFFLVNKLHGMVVLGAVVLCITGGEALYADMGHFGRGPIRIAWFALVFPALLLNYFGQGALLLNFPEMAANPFYGLVPKSFLYPMVALSTTAAVIASQAMISGAFSLTRQAVQLGYFPRVTIVHTSVQTEGQIFIPEVNRIMMIVCIGLVIFFHTSSRLAAAYGIAVTANMAITSIVYFYIIRNSWNWSLSKAVSLVGVFLFFDFMYFGANVLKIYDGGWFPISVAALIVIIMTTWKAGRSTLYRRMLEKSIPFDQFLEDLARHPVHRIPGTAVFMASSSIMTPPSLLHHFKHNRVLHEQVLLLTIQAVGSPTVPELERVKHEELGLGFFRIVANYGFMETPNVPSIVERICLLGMIPSVETVSYYIGRETLIVTDQPTMIQWRKKLFAFLSRNSRSAAEYFDLPPGRVMELGVQVEL